MGTVGTIKYGMIKNPTGNNWNSSQKVEPASWISVVKNIFNSVARECSKEITVSAIGGSTDNELEKNKKASVHFKAYPLKNSFNYAIYAYTADEGIIGKSAGTQENLKLAHLYWKIEIDAGNNQKDTGREQKDLSSFIAIVNDPGTTDEKKINNFKELCSEIIQRLDSAKV